MEKLGNYDFKEIEEYVVKLWQERGVYDWSSEVKDRDQNFVIDTPPPTVSGVMHMGHVFSYCHVDFLARYQRMMGKNVFFPMGFDDNGLPTERLVEKERKIRASDLSREDFIQICEQISEKYRKIYRNLFEGISLSVDWGQEYNTINSHSRSVSQSSFVKLYEKGLVYQKLQPMLWDPVDLTAIAHAEIEDKEMPSYMNYIKFYKEDGDYVEIATTRPEMLPACCSVFYHPDDDRYNSMEDGFLYTPIFAVKVPLIADEDVKMDKGSGLVMCCTFGDDMDVSWWKRYDLPSDRVILNKYGKLHNIYEIIKENSEIFIEEVGVEAKNYWRKILNEKDEKVKEEAYSEFCASAINSVFDSIICDDNISDTSEKIEAIRESGVNLEDFITLHLMVHELEGMKVKVARTKIIEILEHNDHVIKKDPINHTVKCAERSGAPLELIPTKQWFVKINMPETKKAILASSAEVKWHPKNMEQKLKSWVEGLRFDWCISRQRYFGVPIPVWYSKRPGEEGKVLVPDIDQLPVNPLKDLPKGYTKEEVDPEVDVLDTWATSSLTQNISAGGVNQELAVDKHRFNMLYPADVRSLAHEIIRTWAFYSFVQTCLHNQAKFPWKNLLVSGWCLSKDNEKMSKSKGNIVDPIKILGEYGSDVVRYWAANSRPGSDSAFSDKILKEGRRLVVKLWNATKFVQDNAGIREDEFDPKNILPNLAMDRWVMGKMNRMISDYNEAFDHNNGEIDFCRSREVLQDFFWKIFCDNYLELAKARAYGKDKLVSDLSGSKYNIFDEDHLSAVHSLHYVLRVIIKLLAPFIPNITEKLYQSMYGTGRSVHEVNSFHDIYLCSNFPDDENMFLGDLCVEVMKLIRGVKSNRSMSPKDSISKLYILDIGLNGSEQVKINVDSFITDLVHAGSVNMVHYKLPENFRDKVSSQFQGLENCFEGELNDVSEDNIVISEIEIPIAESKVINCVVALIV